MLVTGLPLMAVGVTIWFVASEELHWFRLSLPLLLATLGIAGVHLYHVARHAGWRPALGQLLLVVAVAWAAEAAGQRWPVPFGARYVYHDALHPVLPGNVPLFIPLAWFALVPAPLALLRGWRLGGAARLLTKAALAALFLVAWDLLLDPLAVSTSAWQWEHSGPYHGVPWSNFAGWFVVAFIIYAGLFLLVADHAGQRGDGIWLGLNLAFLLLAAIAVWRRLDNTLPVLLALAVMLPYWLYWWRSLSALRREGVRGVAIK
jgi:putative membrane protein